LYSEYGPLDPKLILDIIQALNILKGDNDDQISGMAIDLDQRISTNFSDLKIEEAEKKDREKMQKV
jgi:hypothetical protein